MMEDSCHINKNGDKVVYENGSFYKGMSHDYSVIYGNGLVKAWYIDNRHLIAFYFKDHVEIEEKEYRKYLKVIRRKNFLKGIKDGKIKSKDL